MSDQRNNFRQNELYENLEVCTVNVQIAVCCDLTPCGLLDSANVPGHLLPLSTFILKERYRIFPKH